MFMAKAKKKKKKQVKVAKSKKPPRNAKGQLTSGWGKGSKQVKKKLIVKKKKAKRDSKGHLLPGTPALNPAGRPAGTSRIDELNMAMHRIEEKKGQSFLDMCFEKAYKDTAMAVAILRKVHPDLRAIEMLAGSADLIPNEEAAEWRDEMNRRFK